MEPYERERWLMTTHALQRLAMSLNYNMAALERRKEHLRKTWLAAVMDNNTSLCRQVEEDLALSSTAYENARKEHSEALRQLQAYVEQRKQHHHDGNPK